MRQSFDNIIGPGRAGRTGAARSGSIFSRSWTSCKRREHALWRRKDERPFQGCGKQIRKWTGGFWSRRTSSLCGHWTHLEQFGSCNQCSFPRRSCFWSVPFQWSVNFKVFACFDFNNMNNMEFLRVHSLPCWSRDPKKKCIHAIEHWADCCKSRFATKNGCRWQSKQGTFKTSCIEWSWW